MKTWMKLLLVIAMGGLLAILAYVVANDEPSCPISRSGFRQLAPGMTEAEVIRLLQVPPGEYTSGPVDAVNPPLGHIGNQPETFAPARTESWLDDCTGVAVDYDANGKMLHAFAWSHQRGGFIPTLRRLFRPDSPK